MVRYGVPLLASVAKTARTCLSYSGSTCFDLCLGLGRRAQIFRNTCESDLDFARQGLTICAARTPSPRISWPPSDHHPFYPLQEVTAQLTAPCKFRSSTVTTRLAPHRLLVRGSTIPLIRTSRGALKGCVMAGSSLLTSEALFRQVLLSSFSRMANQELRRCHCRIHLTAQRNSTRPY